MLNAAGYTNILRPMLPDLVHLTNLKQEKWNLKKNILFKLIQLRVGRGVWGRPSFFVVCEKTAHRDAARVQNWPIIEISTTQKILLFIIF